jgi:hypothetical protein
LTRLFQFCKRKLLQNEAFCEHQSIFCFMRTRYSKKVADFKFSQVFLSKKILVKTRGKEHQRRR